MWTSLSLVAFLPIIFSLCANSKKTGYPPRPISAHLGLPMKVLFVRWGKMPSISTVPSPGILASPTQVLRQPQKTLWRGSGACSTGNPIPPTCMATPQPGLCLQLCRMSCTRKNHLPGQISASPWQSSILFCPWSGLPSINTGIHTTTSTWLFKSRRGNLKLFIPQNAPLLPPSIPCLDGVNESSAHVDHCSSIRDHLGLFLHPGCPGLCSDIWGHPHL